MRDLIDDPHPEFTAAMMADLTGVGMPYETRETGSGQLSDGPVVSEWPKSRNVSQRPPLGLNAHSAHILDGLDRIYTAALRAMGTDPIPLAGTEAWVEGDESYRKRLGHVRNEHPVWWLDAKSWDDLGLIAGLTRARLVPVPVQQDG